MEGSVLTARQIKRCGFFRFLAERRMQTRDRVVRFEREWYCPPSTGPVAATENS